MRTKAVVATAIPANKGIFSVRNVSFPHSLHTDGSDVIGFHNSGGFEYIERKVLSVNEGEKFNRSTFAESKFCEWRKPTVCVCAKEKV